MSLRDLDLDWRTVTSSNLVAVAYDVQEERLLIRFKNGTTYEYAGVPEDVYLGLLRASSKGEYHAANVKWSYPYRKV